jgi:probable phosphoglycerate mutase
LIAFVRHGQTTINRDRKLQGRVDAVLTDLGREQAAALGTAFASDPVTRVVASPLQRALDTAAPIAHAHALAVEPDERLVELDYGAWDELGLRDIPPADWAQWRADPSFAPPEGESLVDVTARVVDFCNEHLDDDLVVAVSHVSPIKVAVCWALGIDEQATWRMFLELASVTRIGRRDGVQPYLASFNEVPWSSASVPDRR